MKKLFLLLFVLSCSQNPLKEYGDDVNNAQPPVQEPIFEEDDGEDVAPSNYLQIDVAPGIINFFEGKEGEFSVKGRLVDLEKDTPYILELEGLPEGAEFDLETGVIKWTPEVDFVGNDQASRFVIIRAKMATTKKPIMAVEKNFNIWVNRVTSRPKIVDVRPATSNGLKEGQSKQFLVNFESIDGVGAVLSFSSETWDKSLAPFAQQLGANQEISPGVWQARFVINLANRELTEAEETFKMGIMITDEDSMTSLVTEFSQTVVTRVYPPTLTWTHALLFKSLENNRFTFQIYIPNIGVVNQSPAGELSTQGFEQACQGSEVELICACTVMSSSLVQCTIAGTPTEEQKGFHVLEFSATNANSFDPQENRTEQFRVALEVE